VDEVKLDFDPKSPFAHLAAEPAFALPERHRIVVRWIPFALRIRGKAERSRHSEWKARYSYLGEDDRVTLLEERLRDAGRARG